MCLGAVGSSRATSTTSGTRCARRTRFGMPGGGWWIRCPIGSRGRSGSTRCSDRSPRSKGARGTAGVGRGSGAGGGARVGHPHAASATPGPKPAPRAAPRAARAARQREGGASGRRGCCEGRRGGCSTSFAAAAVPSVRHPPHLVPRRPRLTSKSWTWNVCVHRARRRWRRVAAARRRPHPAATAHAAAAGRRAGAAQPGAGTAPLPSSPPCAVQQRSQAASERLLLAVRVG